MTPNNKYFKKTNKESWIEFVRSQSDSDPNVDSKVEDSCSSDRRLCLVCVENEKQLNLFVLRPPEHFNGRLQNDLAVIHSTLYLSSDQEVGGPLAFPDISDSFWETEEYFNKVQLAKIQQEILKCTSGTLSTDSFAEVSSEMFSEKWTYLKALRAKLKDSRKEEQLDIVKRDVFLRYDTSELSLSPSKWPERAWLLKMDPNARVENSSVNGEKENLSFLTTASSLNIKDILEKFRSDGMPVKTDLAPLPPLAKGSADRHVQVLLTRDAEDIKRQLYPEALETFYHGKEYCLDESSSLSKDSKLVQLQCSVVKNETLSSYVQTDRKQATRRCSRIRNETGATLATTNKPARAKRSNQALGGLLKRKSPVVKKTTVAAKRKRETSVEEANSEQTKEDKKKETRSERHKRRLRQVVLKTLEDNGIDPSHTLYKRCTERLYSLCKSFLKDLCSSHGLNDEMKRLASSNVQQVIEFETNKVKRSEEET